MSENTHWIPEESQQCSAGWLPHGGLRSRLLVINIKAPHLTQWRHPCSEYLQGKINVCELRVQQWPMAPHKALEVPMLRLAHGPHCSQLWLSPQSLSLTDRTAMPSAHSRAPVRPSGPVSPEVGGILGPKREAPTSSGVSQKTNLELPGLPEDRGFSWVHGLAQSVCHQDYQPGLAGAAIWSLT